MTDPHDIDVLILGAGINGAGLFRDLCEQGASCVIADKGDFGGGTSAAPSRLIHGGIKYLETGELRLVAQSTYERNLLLRNAPHLVRPLVGHDPGRLMIPAALSGAALLLAADISVRLIPSTSEIKVGVLTALIGAPFFIVMILRRRSTLAGGGA